ncbi:MAG: nucleoside 2-deoxyribosyltransferase [Ignavibacteria bacterium RBG_16_34_14]|nr:MAG: nucleoside 2-deoxyribosyltransferase [Ignavibacteria bacterium RBG_16_34_14]
MPPDITQLIKTLKREKADYIPIVELGIHPKIKERFLSKSILNLKDEVEFWYNAGYDYIKLQPIFNFDPNKIVSEDKPDSTRKWASEGEGLIKSFDDFEKFHFPKVEEINYSNFERIKEYLPEGMGVIGQYGDIFTMTWEMMGFETFSLALFENPTLVKLLNEKIGQLILSMFEYFAQSDVVDVIWYSDDIAYQSSLMISPADLDKYFFPWLKKIGELAKKCNKPFIYHSDGILYSVMDKIIDCGVDALHPIEPKAMDISEVKGRYGKKLCLIGNVDVDLLCRGREDEIRTQVLYNIEKVGFNGGYCVGSGNSIPDYVKYENYIAMIETVKEFNLRRT